MQASRHSSGISMSAIAGLTSAGLTSTGSGSDEFALAICTSGCSGDGAGDESVGAASTNNFGWSGAVMAAVAIPVSGSTAGAASALTTVAVQIAAGCGESARSVLAVSNAA